jgi:hypothetical protein
MYADKIHHNVSADNPLAILKIDPQSIMSIKSIVA